MQCFRGNPRWWTIAIGLAAIFLNGISAVASADRKSPVTQWVTLSGCRLLPNKYNDGDSFHVVHGGREYLSRLCYVDTPETSAHKEFVKRTSDQAKYWKILKRDLFTLADEASAFSAAQLAAPFTVMTQWEDARGASQMPRYFAVVRTASGKDLAEELVSNGLARVYGFVPALPGGKSPQDVRKKLDALEAAAKAKGTGAWAYSRGSSKKPKASSSPRKEKAKPSPTPVKTRSLDSIPAY
jgi:endonuclease YncB( thermonuclease family)